MLRGGKYFDFLFYYKVRWRIIFEYISKCHPTGENNNSTVQLGYECFTQFIVSIFCNIQKKDYFILVRFLKKAVSCTK